MPGNRLTELGGLVLSDVGSVFPSILFTMCNRYRPASVTYVRDVFGFTLIKEREATPPTTPRASAPGRKGRSCIRAGSMSGNGD